MNVRFANEFLNEFYNLSIDQQSKIKELIGICQLVPENLYQFSQNFENPVNEFNLPATPVRLIPQRGAQAVLFIESIHDFKSFLFGHKNAIESVFKESLRKTTVDGILRTVLATPFYGLFVNILGAFALVPFLMIAAVVNSLIGFPDLQATERAFNFLFSLGFKNTLNAWLVRQLISSSLILAMSLSMFKDNYSKISKTLSMFRELVTDVLTNRTELEAVVIEEMIDESFINPQCNNTIYVDKTSKSLKIDWSTLEDEKNIIVSPSCTPDDAIAFLQGLPSNSTLIKSISLSDGYSDSSVLLFLNHELFLRLKKSQYYSIMSYVFSEDNFNNYRDFPSQVYQNLNHARNVLYPKLQYSNTFEAMLFEANDCMMNKNVKGALKLMCKFPKELGSDNKIAIRQRLYHGLMNISEDNLKQILLTLPNTARNYMLVLDVIIETLANTDKNASKQYLIELCNALLVDYPKRDSLKDNIRLLKKSRGDTMTSAFDTDLLFFEKEPDATTPLILNSELSTDLSSARNA